MFKQALFFLLQFIIITYIKFQRESTTCQKSIYEDIYKDLKRKIEKDIFKYQELLPSENSLVQTYDCSRNTVRRAIQCLVTDGYVQTVQGKGVRNIYRPSQQSVFTIGEIETFRESDEKK